MEDLLNKKFGLITIKNVLNTDSRGTKYEALCQCGTVVEVYHNELVNADKVDCGECLTYKGREAIQIYIRGTVSIEVLKSEEEDFFNQYREEIRKFNITRQSPLPDKPKSGILDEEKRIKNKLQYQVQKQKKQEDEEFNRQRIEQLNLIKNYNKHYKLDRTEDIIEKNKTLKPQVVNTKFVLENNTSNLSHTEKLDIFIKTDILPEELKQYMIDNELTRYQMMDSTEAFDKYRKLNNRYKKIKEDYKKQQEKKPKLTPEERASNLKRYIMPYRLTKIENSIKNYLKNYDDKFYSTYFYKLFKEVHTKRLDIHHRWYLNYENFSKDVLDDYLKIIKDYPESTVLLTKIDKNKDWSKDNFKFHSLYKSKL